MFQYALGRSLAIKRGERMKLDTSSYTSTIPDTYQDIRIYGLKNFNIKAEEANQDEIGKYFWLYRNKWTRKIWKLRSKIQSGSYTKFSYIEEPKNNYWKFDSTLENYSSPSIYLNGYWQTEKYFKEIREVLLEEFSVKTPADARNQALLTEIKNKNSINLHIRLGNNTDPKNPIGTLSMDYYDQAIKMMAEKVKDPHFFIFSDDSEWAKKHLKINHPCTFVGNKESQDYEDMRLMVNCKHHITANSTFSWWGAWLSTNPDKIIISPDRYVQRSEQPNPDLFPESWITLNLKK